MTARLPRATELRCADCGYRTTRTTAAMAAKAMTTHSCALQRDRNRRAAVVAARKASSGTVRDCEHTQSRHEHGTRNAYVSDRCRCRPCRDASAAYAHRVDKLKAYGQFAPFTSATVVLEHVRTLQATGMGWKRISELTGVSHGAMTKLLYGKRLPDGTRRPTTQLRRETADRILALKPDTDLLLGHTVVDGTGTRRRLRALVAHGWSQVLLAQRLNMTGSNFGRVLRSDDNVHADTARRVRALYDALWDTPPPAHDARSRTTMTRAKQLAAKSGWLPALAWDDSTIDDPSAWADLGYGGDDDHPDDVLDEIAIERFINADLPWQSLSKDERIAAGIRMQELGYSRNQIHDHCHVRSQELHAALNAARHAA